MPIPAQPWLDADVRRGERDRCTSGAVPETAPLLGPEDQELLRRWLRADNPRRSRASLLKDAGRDGIERAESLCERLLREGWIVRRERLAGGSWQWQWITWRDLDRLKRLLGVGSARQREEERSGLLEQFRSWLAHWAEATAGPAPDPDLLDEMRAALQQLGEERALKLETLRTRLELLEALAQWCAAGRRELRRDFALWARGSTKAMGAGDWRWLASAFDLERLGIASFAPVLWLAGEVSLHWGERRLDAGALHCVGVPMRDARRIERLSCPGGGLRGYWLIENRASFERQAEALPAGELALWVPGRPSAEWLESVAHLLRLAPAPAAISADADPAGVDIACTVAAIWRQQGLSWSPRRMGVAEWQATSQRWPLNAHDLALLQRLLQDVGLHPELRALCEAMRSEGRKAEQESWL
ncbi:MAG TPA: hypothetical protein VFM98_03755 [Ramlibacter sp.]|uniref:hypothetical protein n=1 Tax=Ramlibacter sp. TaxID=1917967 RepID=UPI002D81061D|nr:hypothetical protein [Ramlibacter sp.]HET8744696.1 hypothetical protein [Ramlibacter sp.]